MDFLGDLPSWIIASASIGAFYMTWRAAKSTSRTVRAAETQVAAVQGQLRLTQQQLAIAESDADREREVAEAAQLRFLQAQLDTRAPVVYGRARPGCDLPEYTYTLGSGLSFGLAPLAALTPRKARQQADRAHPDDAVTERFTVGKDDEPLLLLQAVTFEFVNCSDLPARVDITERGGGEMSIRQGQELIVPPHETRSVVWTRRLTSQQLSTQEQIDDSKISFLFLEYWVRDLGMNTRDTHRYNLDMRYFKRDGSRLIVEPQPAFPWTEKFAGQAEQRVYERLEAEAERARPSTMN